MADTAALHSAHPYPCKFPPQVVTNHLPPRGLVVDPYCGSGTTLLEAAVRGLNVFGIDCNPIAILITQCKLADLPAEQFSQLESALNVSTNVQKALKFDFPLHEFPGRDHWFSPQAQREFAYALSVLDSYGQGSPEWLVLATALSAVTNTYSNQDSETRYAAVAKEHQPGDMTTAFIKKSVRIIDGIRRRGPLSSQRGSHLGDLRVGAPIPPGSADVIITSPPYANTMDYYLYHKQRMNILRFDFKQAQNAEIGSRHQFSSKKDDLSRWNADYELGMKQALGLLRKGGQAWFIIGDSKVAGQHVDGGQLTVNSAANLGYEARILESVPMAGKSRMFNSEFQAADKFEHVVHIRG